MTTIFQKIYFLLAIAAMVSACSPDKQVSTPDNLILAWQNHYNSDLVLAQKITSVAYNPTNNFVVFALEPGMPGQPNIFKMEFNSEMSPGKQLKLNLARITNGPIRHIRISSDGKYTALAGRTRELILLKNESAYAQFDLADEVASMEFGGKNENILAVGDRKGKLIFIDLEKATIIDTVQLFNEEVTSLAFYKENQVLVTGNDPRIIQVDVLSGKTTRIIETLGIKEKILHATGLQHCHKDRINQVLYVADQDKIVTSHGWDYCSDLRIAVWDAETGNLVKKITRLKHPVFQMAWVERLRTLVLVDHERNMMKLSLDDFNMTHPILLPNTLAHYVSPKKNEPASIPLGHVQSMISIPGTNLLLMATGSYFKAGAGVLLTELGADSMKHIARLTINVRGDANLFVIEELFPKVYPSSS